MYKICHKKKKVFPAKIMENLAFFFSHFKLLCWLLSYFYSYHSISFHFICQITCKFYNQHFYNEKYRELREDTTLILTKSISRLPEWTARNIHLWYAHGDRGHDRKKKPKGQKNPNRNRKSLLKRQTLRLLPEHKTRGQTKAEVHPPATHQPQSSARNQLLT